MSIAQGQLTGLRPDDVVVSAGVIDGFATVRVTRGGGEVGLLQFDRDPDGGWLLSQWMLCAGLGLVTDAPPCRLGDCGSATLDPAAAPAGASVRLKADNGYFGLWTPERWAELCPELSIALHETGDLLPGSGILVPLTMVDDDAASFVVPELAAGTYAPFLSCSGDEAFGQPKLPDVFTVLPGGA